MKNKNKFCIICGIEKSEENTYKKSQKNYKCLSSYCKKCFSKYSINRWVEKKKKFIKYKGGKCLICEYNSFYGALEFHHLDPKEKEFDWKKLRLFSEKRIKKELDKCILLCSNCHRELEHISGSLT